jgi:flavin reductase (DIM6/NTAB) family NADH-FMN oxidoreductase RutF
LGTGDLMIETVVLDPLRLRRVLGAFPSGVTAVAALIDGSPVGITASSFTSVSLEPPLVSVCIAHDSRAWAVLSKAARIGVSILSAEQEHVGRQLAQRAGDKFAGLDWRATVDGAVLLDGAGAWLETRLHRRIRAGDHDIALLEVQDLDADHDLPPLVFHASRFRRLQA